MRIINANVSSAATETGRSSESQRTSRETGSTASGAAGSGNGDRVELSGALGNLSRMLSGFALARTQRVQELSRQYEAGHYQPAAAATSSSLISEALADRNG